ncbi:MAG: cellulase family glycosylhydrolase [Solirubrobacterales bacterium]
MRRLTHLTSFGIALTGAIVAGLVGSSSAVAGCGLLGLEECPPRNSWESPDPGGDESAIVPVPPPGGKLLGFNDNSFLIPSRGVGPGAQAELALRFGANAGRINTDWRYLEPTRDVWREDQWNVYQRYYDALISRGMKPLVVIGYAPAWARDPGSPQTCTEHWRCEFPPARHLLDEWRQFAAEVTRRFPLAAISIWNEPNLQQNWNHPNPSRWAELVVHAYRAIKAVNPGAEVVGGGLANNQGVTSDYYSGESIALSKFLWAAYSSTPSIKGHMDAIGLNATSRSLDMGKNTLFSKSFQDIRSNRALFNDSETPIWVTETGLSTTDGLSQAQHADGLLRMYRRVMTMDDVEAMFVHTLIDLYEVPPDAWDRGVGVLELGQNGWPKPKLAYCAFAGRVDTDDPPFDCPRIVEEDVDPPPDPSSCDLAAKLKQRLRALRAKILRARENGNHLRVRELRARRDRVRVRYQTAKAACAATTA